VIIKRWGPINQRLELLPYAGELPGVAAITYPALAGGYIVDRIFQRFIYTKMQSHHLAFVF
jgi:hypothetical protein